LPPAAQACTLLSDAGIPLGRQSVLLKGVNDEPSVMRELMRRLLTIRVRPYYIRQMDLARGTGHLSWRPCAGMFRESAFRSMLLTCRAAQGAAAARVCGGDERRAAADKKLPEQNLQLSIRR